ncbi:MAG: 16S rRNA (cytidine(1402)-2'-O)-methyltransferase [Candidatus Hydrogenedentes bacterium]|nr:16S rRNA (cytidine(1402)-2'-O)-methyltransferase [Candidatus Hydrogenedentota bacterium]
MPCGRLFVVATPLGNLEDVSPRAVRVLGEVDLIAAEDTRHSRRLLRHYAISKPLISYHEHNEPERAVELIRRLNDGRDVALISDAGTPCISDPGYRVVRAAQEAGIEVVSVPGPSAVVAALSVSGLPADRYTFHGFFPRHAGAAYTLLSELGRLGGTHVFFEAPSRLIATLRHVIEDLAEAEVCVARELTKMFEQVTTGSPQALFEQYCGSRIRGECVLVIHVPAARIRESEYSSEQLREHVQERLRKGLSQRDAVRAVAEALGVSRNRVYAAAVEKNGAD